MTKEEIIKKLDSYPWSKKTSTDLLVGFNISQAITLHRVKIGNTISDPIITIMQPNIIANVDFDYLDKNFINYSIMEFMSYDEFMKQYKDLDEAQRKLSIKLKNKKNE